MQTLVLFKARIAVLWIVAAVAMSAHMILMSFDPVVMKSAAGWAVSAGQGEWIFLALFWLVPLWMAFLAVTLRDPINRWVSGGGGHPVYHPGPLALLHLWRAAIEGRSLCRAGSSPRTAGGFVRCGDGPDCLVCLELAENESLRNQALAPSSDRGKGRIVTP